MIFFDSETCGLHGVPVIIQYAIDDGPVIIHDVWGTPAIETINLFKKFATHQGGIVGFNLAFDWFHVYKTWCMFNMLPNLDWIPELHIKELVDLEMSARDNLCLKPVKACDIMLHARKGPYQSTMDRSDIRIKRVPTALANKLAPELDRLIPLPDIYFARRTDKTLPQWQVENIIDKETKAIDPDFKNVVLRFRPSSSLKALAVDALGVNVTTYSEIEINPKLRPDELGYAPFAKATEQNWSTVLHLHLDHWRTNQAARRYSMDDVIYTRDLYKYFGSPELGDDDSELACMVSCVRWKGYKINEDKILQLKNEAAVRAKGAPRSPSEVKKYIHAQLTNIEIAATGGSTAKLVLEEIADFKIDCECIEGCEKCNNTGTIPHPAAIRAKEVIAARTAEKEVDLYDKLLKAGRFHASFKVIGTLSSRMSGADGLNPQGIKGTKEVRSCFPLAFDDYVLCGGDFKAFEIVLAEACYNDPQLREDLQQGKKIHALFAECLFPDETYETIMASEGTENDMYRIGKSAVFSQLYGGNEHTLKTRLGIDVSIGLDASRRFEEKYKGVGAKRKEIQERFCSMTQPGGLGKKVEWREPDEVMKSLLGFPRYFTLENRICKALYNLAESPPKDWLNLKIKVVRRDRIQTAAGAARSALFGAAFAIQSANMRAAANHEIQSSGAQITKAVQRKIWDLQPSGPSTWKVQPMNIHDEILTVCHPSVVKQVTQAVRDSVDSFKERVPLIAIDWVEGMNSWANKKG